MRIDPGLRALRGKAAPQRQAQEALYAARDIWRERPEWRELGEAFAAYGAGDALQSSEPLSRLFTWKGHAESLARAFVAHFLPAMGAAPMGQFPSRYVVNGSVSTLLLASAGRAVLSLVVLDGNLLASRPAAQCVSLAEGERHEIVLAGRATGSKVTALAVTGNHADLATEPHIWAPGVRLSMDTAREAVLVDDVKGALVSLRLMRMAANPGPTRDYALADGALVHQSAGDARESRLELMLALLGRMGRRDAAPAIARMAVEGGGAQALTAPPGLRWQALRECLALDTREGFHALCAVARDTGDPLAGPAGALRAQLLESHPVLGRLMAEWEEQEAVCPA